MRTSSLTLHAASQDTRNRRATRPSSHRLVAAAEIAALIAIALSLIVGTLATSSDAGHDASCTARVFVEQGDTAWTLAQQHPVSGQTTEQTAEQIIDLNADTKNGIKPGTAVKVPVSSDDKSMVAYR
jgi:hypothetical protein